MFFSPNVMYKTIERIHFPQPQLLYIKKLMSVKKCATSQRPKIGGHHHNYSHRALPAQPEVHYEGSKCHEYAAENTSKVKLKIFSN